MTTVMIPVKHDNIDLIYFLKSIKDFQLQSEANPYKNTTFM